MHDFAPSCKVSGHATAGGGDGGVYQAELETNKVPSNGYVEPINVPIGLEDSTIEYENKARDKLEKSMVADNDSGKSIESEVRTSSGMFLDKHQDKIIFGIETRLAAWTFLTKGHGLTYEVDSIKAELQNKLYLMLSRRTFARRQGQTRILLVTYIEDSKNCTYTEDISAETSYTAEGKSSESSLSPLKRQLSHIAITEDMAPKKHLVDRAFKGTSESEQTVGMPAQKQSR